MVGDHVPGPSTIVTCHSVVAGFPDFDASFERVPLLPVITISLRVSFTLPPCDQSRSYFRILHKPAPDQQVLQKTLIIDNMFTKICDAEDASCFIKNMRQQEASGYVKPNYLKTTSAGNDQDHAHPISRNKGPLNGEDADEDCRSRMTEWCFQVVDFCKYQRETVEIVMSYFDRFLGTPEGASTLKDRKMFQLAAMTCLYTAIKIHEPEAMEPQVISGLSRGVYSADDIEDMERKILAAIRWRLNPPTTMSFVRFFAALVPDGIWADDEFESIVALAKYQTELAVGEYSFVGVNASTIAFAALSNALQAIDNVALSNDLMKKVSSTANIDVDSHEMVTTRERLWTAMDKKSDDPQRYLMPQSPTVQKATQRSSAVYGSPRGVISTR